MKNSDEKKQLVKNEQAARAKNTKIKDGIKKYFRSSKQVTDQPVPFTCECSDLKCGGKIYLSIEDFEKVHKRRDYFTIKKGHDTPAVEKVVKEKTDFSVVEKDVLNKS